MDDDSLWYFATSMGIRCVYTTVETAGWRQKLLGEKKTQIRRIS